jgi:hypothetical protein
MPVTTDILPETVDAAEINDACAITAYINETIDSLTELTQCLHA